MANKKAILYGFLDFEVKEFQPQYTEEDMRSLPYFVSMRRARVRYIAYYRNRDFTTEEIEQRILGLYLKKGWIRNNRYDPWQMLKAYRKQAIGNNKYIPPQRKGSHHKQEITEKELARQRVSRLERYAKGRGKE